MDFLEDLFDIGDRKHRRRGGYSQNGEHHDHDDDHDYDDSHHHPYPNNAYPQTQPNPTAHMPGLICRKCSTQTIQGAKFCHVCGVAVEVNAVCAACGSKLPPNALFCAQCGYKSP